MELISNSLKEVHPTRSQGKSSEFMELISNSLKEVHPTRSQGKSSEFMELISNSPQEGTFHEEPLKLLYAENRHCFFCPNRWLVLWNKPSSTHRCFFLCANFSLKRKEKKRGHAKALKGEKKGSKDKDAITKFTRAVDVGWQPTLHLPIGWSHLNPRCLRMEDPSPALQTQGFALTVVSTHN